MEELVSWHNDPALKQEYVEQILAHEKADEIIKGTYWEDGKGCAVGCLVHSSDHALFESCMGIPEWFARLIDVIFEGLPNEKAKLFPRQIVEAVPVGKNEDWWNQVKWRFLAFILQENLERVNSLDISYDLKTRVTDAIKGVASVVDDAVRTGKWNESAARSARSAAESAARSAESAAWSAESAARSAWSAARSAARSAWSAARSAESTARSAARSAESAARSAARSAWSAARSVGYKRYAGKLLELLTQEQE